MADEFQNVRQDNFIYDMIRIGTDVPAIPGWFNTFTAFAAKDDYHSFLDVRTESQCTATYTNIRKLGGLDYPFICVDMGMEFSYPNPANTPAFDGDRAAAKLFCETIPKHCNVSLFIGGADNKILTAKPDFLPYGYGTTGQQVGGNLVSYASIFTAGQSHASNAFKFADQPLVIPDNKYLALRLTLSTTAKNILNQMVAPQPVVFQHGTWANEATITLRLRGTRDIGQVGNIRR